MTDATEKWTLAEYHEYERSGLSPERKAKLDAKKKRHEQRMERDLQTACENWLHQRGYLRLTADNAEKARDIAFAPGWFGHLSEARRNPLMPDLFIFDAAMRECLMVELKTRAVYQPGQLEMIRSGAWCECNTFDGFAETVTTWEEKGGNV